MIQTVMFTPDQRVIGKLETLSRGLAAAVIGLGIMVLAGWFLDVPFLRSCGSGFVSMKINTAICFILLGLALSHCCRRRIGTLLSLFAMIIAASVLLEYLTGRDFGIDQLLAADPGDPGTINLGRIGPIAAINFLLVGGSQVIPREQERWVKVSQSMLLLVVMLGVASLLGHLFSINDLGTVWGLTRMAIHTAAGFVLLGFSGLLVRPESGWMNILTSKSIAGVMARRILPLTIVIPLIGNVLRVLGERVGCFDRATGIYIMVTGGTALLMFGTIAGAQILRRLDDERHHLDLELMERRELDGIRQNFLSAVTHELRSPLGAIGMYAHLIDPHLGGTSVAPASAREHLSRIRSNVERLSGFIDDLLLLSQIERGTMDFTRSPIKIQDLAGELLSGFDRTCADRKIRIENSIPSGLPPVLGDVALLKSALSHLITNALKFTPAGGTIVLAAKVGPGHDERMVELRVSDTGSGLSATDLRLLFQGFRQGANINERHSGTQGAGIGLYLVKSLIEAHGGRVRAESELGKGTTVFFTLPLA